MSRDLWTGIKEKYDKIEKEDPEAPDPEKLWPAFKAIDYFAYLIVTGEIKDKVVRYYRDELTSVIEFLLSRYGDTYRRLRYADKYINLDKLIAKWEISVTE